MQRHPSPLVSRSQSFSALFALLVSLSPLSCNQASSQGERESAGGASGGVSGDGDISLGVTGGAGSGDDGLPERPRDGGRIGLTNEEVDAILGAGCSGWSAEGESIPAVLQLVVDVSGSMEWQSPGSFESKWDVTKVALEQAIAEMPASISLGLLFYPNLPGEEPEDPSECVQTSEAVSIGLLGDVGSAQRSAIATAFQSVYTGWATPTYDAFNYALNEIMIPHQTISKKFMLLITDGAPTVEEGCVLVGDGQGDAPTDPIAALIDGAKINHDVRTFLIGSPGSEESSDGIGDMRPWLSAAAVLGGTAKETCQPQGPDFCHMDMTQEPNFAQALKDGLKDIAGQIVDSCTFKVPAPPAGETIDPKLTNVIVRWGSGTNSLILADDVADCNDGWKFDAAGDIELCPATCDEVKLDPQARLSLNFGCNTDDIVVR